MVSSNYLTFDPKTGAVQGSGFTPDGTLPKNAAPCTAAQAADPKSYAVDPKTKAISGISAKAKLVAAQSAKVAELRADCAKAILGGFASSALGDSHTYPSDKESQRNLIGLVAGAGGGKFWCADASGAWSYASHTAAQIKQVLKDAITAREAMSAQLETLSNEASSASDPSAIKWVNP